MKQDKVKLSIPSGKGRKMRTRQEIVEMRDKLLANQDDGSRMVRGRGRGQRGVPTTNVCVLLAAMLQWTLGKDFVGVE